MKLFLPFFLLLYLGYCPDMVGNDTVRIAPQHFNIDHAKKLIVSNQPLAFLNQNWPLLKTHIFLRELCLFDPAVNQLEPGKAYPIYIPSIDDHYQIFFTGLPMVRISSPDSIVDLQKVPAFFTLTEPNGNQIQSHAGIEYRGGYSQILPKKSMELEFWTDASGQTTIDRSLLGMANDDDWNLQAMANEPLRIRSKTNFDLWRQIHSLYYQAQEPDAINGIRMAYVELFLNQEYRGLYGIGEKINRKQLKLKSHNGSIRGELYKGVSWDSACTFRNAPPFSNDSLIWSGFEYKHPEEITNWTNLFKLVQFVTAASADSFYSFYPQYFRKESLVDYYIFLNLLRASDNTGKNIYIARYNTSHPYFYIPWDLDGTFGTVWDGSREPTSNDLLSNGFYDRLRHDCQPGGFWDMLKSKWNALRSSLLTKELLMQGFRQQHDFLVQNGVYQRESIAWPDYQYDSTGLAYMEEWIGNRLYFLDQAFSGDCLPVNTMEIRSEKSTDRSIWPNPGNGTFTLDFNSTGPKHFTISNTLGKVIYNGFCAEMPCKIEISDIPDGVYFLQTNSHNHLKSIRLIIQK